MTKIGKLPEYFNAALRSNCVPKLALNRKSVVLPNHAAKLSRSRYLAVSGEAEPCVVRPEYVLPTPCVGKHSLEIDRSVELRRVVSKSSPELRRSHHFRRAISKMLLHRNMNEMMKPHKFFPTGKLFPGSTVALFPRRLPVSISFSFCAEDTISHALRPRCSKPAISRFLQHLCLDTNMRRKSDRAEPKDPAPSPDSSGSPDPVFVLDCASLPQPLRALAPDTSSCRVRFHAPRCMYRP